MSKMGKAPKKKHKKMKPVAQEYLELWGDKNARRGGNPAEKQKMFQQQKINSKPPKPSEQELPQRLKELMDSKHKAKEQKKKNRKKRTDVLNDVRFEDKPQKGMTRPVERTPRFQRNKYETDRDFIQRVEVQCKNFVDRRKFEVAHEIIKPEDDPVLQDPKKDEKIKNESEKAEKKQEKERIQSIKKPVRLETVKSSRKMCIAKDKKAKLATKKDATGFEKFSDKVKFGEVAMAPPTISAKPRGTLTSKEKTPKRKVGNLLLLNKFKTSGKDDGKIDLTAKRKDLPFATRRKLDNERDRVVEMYREMKKRKLEGKLPK